MSVLIKGMKMPKDCRECLMQVYYSSGNTWCKPADRLLAEDYKPIPFDGRPDWCPMVELPEKHGKLMDGIELINYCKDMINLNHTPGYNRDASIEERVYTNIIGHIINMPTVIEAEGEE